MVKVTKRGKKSWVTFTIDKPDCETLYIKGSWDNWISRKMRRKRNGEFYITRIIPTGSRYEFGFETEEGEWVIDEFLDKTPTPFGSFNSVLEL